MLSYTVVGFCVSAVLVNDGVIKVSTSMIGIGVGLLSDIVKGLVLWGQQ